MAFQNGRIFVDDAADVARHSAVDGLVDVGEVPLPTLHRRKRFGAHQTLDATSFQIYNTCKTKRAVLTHA